MLDHGFIGDRRLDQGVVEQGTNLTLGALTAAATLGLNLNATSASGMQVGIVVLPAL